jgi:hypothetical protein
MTSDIVTLCLPDSQAVANHSAVLWCSIGPLVKAKGPLVNSNRTVRGWAARMSESADLPRWLAGEACSVATATGSPGCGEWQSRGQSGLGNLVIVGERGTLLRHFGFDILLGFFLDRQPSGVASARTG